MPFFNVRVRPSTVPNGLKKVLDVHLVRKTAFLLLNDHWLSILRVTKDLPSAAVPAHDHQATCTVNLNSLTVLWPVRIHRAVVPQHLITLNHVRSVQSQFKDHDQIIKLVHCDLSVRCLKNAPLRIFASGGSHGLRIRFSDQPTSNINLMNRVIDNVA